MHAQYLNLMLLISFDLQHIFCTVPIVVFILYKYIWRPPSLSELTPMIFNMVLTHLGLETFIYNLTTQHNETNSPKNIFSLFLKI